MRTEDHRSMYSSVVKSVSLGTVRVGRTRMCPGRIGRRLTMAVVRRLGEV